MPQPGILGKKHSWLWLNMYKHDQEKMCMVLMESRHKPPHYKSKSKVVGTSWRIKRRAFQISTTWETGRILTAVLPCNTTNMNIFYSPQNMQNFPATRQVGFALSVIHAMFFFGIEKVMGLTRCHDAKEISVLPTLQLIAKGGWISLKTKCPMRHHAWTNRLERPSKKCGQRLVYSPCGALAA